MGILDMASASSVYRGHVYYKNENVISYKQLSDFEYEGEVEGTRKTPYHVIINKKHPKSSYCDCPFANGNKICKHMVALFFAVSPEELKDYEDWSENDYDEEEYDENLEDYYDEYDDYEEKSNFIKPIFFDKILSNYVDNLSEEDAKNILKKELEKSEEYTFYNYLQKEYKRYSSNKNNIYVILDKLNKNFYDFSHNYDYNNKDYKVKFLTKSEKEILLDAYINNKDLKLIIDKIFLNPEIATYDNYKWFATLYKNHNSKNDIKVYVEKLESFFNTLKHYSIKNTVPKSNVLITIYLLNNFNIEEIAKLLVKYCKYKEYIDYIIENTKDITKLYKEFDKLVENEKYINNEYIAKVYFWFYLKKLDDKIYNKFLYHDFLHSKDYYDLIKLKNTSEFDFYIDKMLKNVKDIITLERIYLFIDDKKNLFKLLYNQENEYRLMANIENLKDEYNDELLNFLKESFYKVVSCEKNRENYKRAANYVEAMSRLNDGEKYVNDLINELKNSEYSKRIALFDELNKVINKNN